MYAGKHMRGTVPGLPVAKYELVLSKAERRWVDEGMPMDDGPVSRLVEYARSVGMGLLAGLGLVCVLTFFFVTVPMTERRWDMETAASESPTTLEVPLLSADGTPADEGSLPPLDWSLVLSREEQMNTEAIEDDLMGMSEVNSWNILGWPVLPYPVTGVDDWTERFDKFGRLLDVVYDRHPELSVYTNGQRALSSVAVAKYHLVDSDGDDAQKNRREFEVVTSTADLMHYRLEQRVLEDEGVRQAIQYSGISDDEAYVMLAYMKLTGRTTYSDDVDDSEHANDIYGAMCESESKCYGVACAAKALLNRRGIPSFIATGSKNGDPDRRHAWCVMWIGGGWRVLDVTYGQGYPPMETLDPKAPMAALMGQGGYWRGCLCPLGEYLEVSGMVLDDPCVELMDAYEELVGMSGDLGYDADTKADGNGKLVSGDDEVTITIEL